MKIEVGKYYKDANGDKRWQMRGNCSVVFDYLGSVCYFDQSGCSIHGYDPDLISEWVCVEHPDGTFPARKAGQWWRARSNVVCPRTAEEAVELAQDGAVARAKRIRVQYVPGEKFPRIVGAELAPIPDYENWVKSTDIAISAINSRIRKSNKKWVPNWKELLEKETKKKD